MGKNTYNLGLLTEFEELLICLTVAQFLLPFSQFSAAITNTYPVS